VTLFSKLKHLCLSFFRRAPTADYHAPNEERNLTVVELTGDAPMENDIQVVQEVITPAETREQWPPLPRSPSTRPSHCGSALFSAHLLRCEGSKDHYYEDAAAFNVYNGFAAVADGMTVGSRSDLFADALVRHFVQGEFYLDKLAEQEKEGKRKKVSEREKWWEICSRQWEVQTVRLYSRMTAEEQQQHTLGSGASFIGFWIDQKRNACLYSVGDCYGLWFSGNELRGQLPETSHFNNNPAAVDVRLPLAAENLVFSRFNSLQELPGERLVLCSDALAEYFLTHMPWEKEAEFWQRIEAMNDALFGRWAEAKKAIGELKDDDYTFLMLQFPQTLSDERVTKPAALESSVAAKADKIESEFRVTETASETPANTASDTSSIAEDARKAASIRNGMIEIEQSTVSNYDRRV
jgi:hypothetical protein